MLRTKGHYVEVAFDGETPLQAVMDHMPNIALLDIGMAGRNGLDVARRLRSNDATRGIYLEAVTG